MDSSGWDERYGGAGLVWSERPNAWVAQVAEALPPGRAVDLGCGEGRNALWLAERGWDVTAVDFSAVGLSRMSTLATERLHGEHGRVHPVCADLTTYVADPRSYDLVLISYVHFTADDRRTLLHRAADAVAPGGRLLAIGHDRASAGQGVGGPPDPDLLWTVEGVAADLAGTGLSADVTQWERTVPVDGIDRTAIDTTVVARRPDPNEESA